MKRDPLVLGDNYVLPGDDIGFSRPNGNALIVGTPGSGKTFSIVIPTIGRSFFSNPIMNFAKENDGYAMSRFLAYLGYSVHILNTAHPSLSTIAPDPTMSIENFEDIDSLSASIVDVVIKKTSDDYWQAKAKSLLSALIAGTYMLSEANSDPGILDVLNFFDKLLPTESGNSVETVLDKQFRLLDNACPSCYAVREYNSWHSLPYKTASCVRDTLASVLSAVFPESIREMMKTKPQLDVERFVKNKEALVIISDAIDISQQYYVNIIFRDLMRQLLRYATKCPNGELPREIRFIFDDMACTAPIQGLAHDLSLFRSAGLSAVMFLQSEQQLEAIYKEDAPIIRQNCAVYAYFPGGFDDKSCELVSKRMGLPYEDILYAPMGKVFIMQSGRKPVHIARYATLDSKEYQQYLDANKLTLQQSKKRHKIRE